MVPEKRVPSQKVRTIELSETIAPLYKGGNPYPNPNPHYF